MFSQLKLKHKVSKKFPTNFTAIRCKAFAQSIIQSCTGIHRLAHFSAVYMSIRQKIAPIKGHTISKDIWDKELSLLGDLKEQPEMDCHINEKDT